MICGILKTNVLYLHRVSVRSIQMQMTAHCVLIICEVDITAMLQSARLEL